MHPKLMLIIVLLPLSLKAQNENFHTAGKFEFIDTLKIVAGYQVNPGQLSKNGNYFLMGLYFDGDADSAYSSLYKIDVKKNDGNLISMQLTPPENHFEFFQCSATEDNKILVFTANNFKGWAGNDLAVAFQQPDGSYASARMLDEINSTDTADAYPWLSPDGLRLYYVKEDVLYFSERNKTTDIFSRPAPVLFTGAVETPVLSCWLSNNEKKLFYISDNIIYVATRKKRIKPFTLPVVYTSEFKDFEFIAGLSFTPDQKEMYLYYNGETGKILHYKLK